MMTHLPPVQQFIKSGLPRAYLIEDGVDHNAFIGNTNAKNRNPIVCG